jgi:hypothetical protein
MRHYPWVNILVAHEYATVMTEIWLSSGKGMSALEPLSACYAFSLLTTYLKLQMTLAE